MATASLRRGYDRGYGLLDGALQRVRREKNRRMSDCTHHTVGGADNSRRLMLAFGVIATFMVVEVIGGILSGSLALLADAAHMLTDAFALGLAASAQIFSRKPADSKLHFGYRRAQVLAAFVNGVLLVFLLLWIVFEAVKRFISPVDVDAPLMLWVAAAGLAANVVAFLILHRPGDKDLNVRGAMLHVLGDLLGSVAAIIGAIIIATTGWVRIDPLLSIIVAVLIGVSAIRLLKETSFILLEGAPADIDLEKLKNGLKSASPSICDVHHVKIWQITPDNTRITLHACVDEASDAAAVVKAAKSYLASEFGIHHSTIQIDVGGDCPDMNDEFGDDTKKTSASHSPSHDHAPAASAVPAHQH